MKGKGSMGLGYRCDVERSLGYFPAPGLGGQLDRDVTHQTRNKAKEQMRKKDGEFTSECRIKCAWGTTKRKFWEITGNGLLSQDL